MICHKAIGIDATAKVLFQLSQIPKVIAVIVIGNEDGLPIMPTVDDVVGTVGDDYTTGAWHARYISLERIISNKQICPGFGLISNK
jgi:hypothetical protein